MENFGEKELSPWLVMLVQQELMMCLREMEGTNVIEDEGITVDPSHLLKISWLIRNISLTSSLI
jgi:hypothetical protein